MKSTAMNLYKKRTKKWSEMGNRQKRL
jgi:hypothetical protein